MTYRDTQEAYRDALEMERNSIIAPDEQDEPEVTPTPPEALKPHPYVREFDRVKDDPAALLKFAKTMMLEAVDTNDLVKDLSWLLSNSMSNCDALRAANSELRKALNEIAREELK